MIKKLIYFGLAAFFFFRLVSLFPAHALEQIKIDIEPHSCSTGSCRADLSAIYNEREEKCVSTLEEFKEDPMNNHFWVDDPEITSQGKADERARQFLYWTISKNAIDSHPVLKEIWNYSRNVSYFFIILIAAIIGLGYVIGQRSNFKTNIEVWPSIIKLLALLLYITFSAAIVFLLIQFSEIMMKFFIERLGGNDLFNIYFSGTSQEKNYLDFIGCRDLNFKSQEGVRAEIFLLKATNFTYYVMGTMLILRKILLWFLLFVSPFLAVLMPFVFIRNIGWIWIGVFFQWLFYGPLFALFLGGLAKIWQSGIPFAFDFSRTDKTLGYVYPTAINILYGGPAQVLSPLNNGNYVDTFAEYVITLIMLWAVTFFPWWLLRIFRDYCCDGIMAVKNILLSMYDQMRGGPAPTPPAPSPITNAINTAMKIPKEVEIPVKAKLETLEEIKKTKTEDISKSLNLSVTKLTDIAHVETNRTANYTVRRNLDLLSNPTKAETPTERQKYMNIRNELFNRAVKEDRTARQILTATSSSRVEQLNRRQEIMQTAPQLQPVVHVVSIKANVAREKISAVSSSFTQSVATKPQVITALSQSTKIDADKIQTVLTSFTKNVNLSPLQVVKNIAKETGLDKDKVIAILKAVAELSKTGKEVTAEVAHKENVPEATVEKIIAGQIPLVTEPEKNIEQMVTIPPTVSLEDYEEVKKMWREQYEKGEVPVTENIRSRAEWIGQDIIFITNTLNKLLSDDEALRNQGLDELGFILPIFLINNLKSDELIVYLKAKLEAAKMVEEQFEREKELTEKLKAKADEQLVDVDKPKTNEEEKTMETKKEIDDKNPNDK